jgi:hypothetical protein
MREISCCICLGDYNSPIILNSGITVCYTCSYEINCCPLTRINLTTKITNGIIDKFFRYPLPFNMNTLMKSSNKIEYMNQYDEIKIDDTIENNDFIMNNDEFKVLIDKCINLDYISYNERRCIMHYICEWGDNRYTSTFNEKRRCKFKSCRPIWRAANSLCM